MTDEKTPNAPLFNIQLAVPKTTPAGPTTRSAIRESIGMEASVGKPRVVKPPRFHTGPTIPGLELNNYTDRKHDPEGQYVLITEHKEHIELIKQPLTPEEIAKRDADREKAAIVAEATRRQRRKEGWQITAGLTALGGAIVGVLVYIDRKHPGWFSAEVDDGED